MRSGDSSQLKMLLIKGGTLFLCPYVFTSCIMALMRDCVRRANFTTKPRLKAKFFAFALFMRGYSFQLYCPGNSFMQNFATLYFENETWW